MSDEDRRDLEAQIASFVESSAEPRLAEEVYAKFTKGRVDASSILYAIWQLIDRNRITLDNNLSLTALTGKQLT